MKRKQRVFAWLAALCLLVTMVPMTGRAAGEVKSATISIQHRGNNLDGAEMILRLCDQSGNIERELGRSSTGTITFTEDPSVLEGRKIRLDATLPDGYLLRGGPDNTEIREQYFTPEHLFQSEHTVFLVECPGMDGYLEITDPEHTVAIGDVIDVSGAFDLNSDAHALYYVAPNGTRTRVVCRSTSCTWDDGGGMYVFEDNKIRIVGEGIASIVFDYQTPEGALLRAYLYLFMDSPEEMPDEIPDGQFQAVAYYKEQPLEGTKITVSVRNSEDEKPGRILETGTAGELTFMLPKDEIKEYKLLCVSYELPEGYEVLDEGRHRTEITHFFSLNDTDQYGWPDFSYIAATNPSIDGVLELTQDCIEAKIGDVIDLSGAFDLNAEGFRIYHVAPDGTRTRVVCDNYGGFSDETVYKEDGHKLTIVGYGWTRLLFYYENTCAILEINVPDPADPIDIIEVSDNELIYVYPDGTENRVILTEDASNFASVEGNKDYIPTGSRFEKKPVTAGEIFNKAKEAIKKNFNTENLRVFEMNLWDAAGKAIHKLPGLVKVEMELPENFKAADGKTLMVYRQEDNGNLTRCNTTVEDGWVTFWTDHFSTYILAEVDKNAAEPTKNAGTSAVTSPKTGEDLPVGFIGLVLAAGALVLVTKKKTA